MAAVEVRGLTKSYGSVDAVRGIDLTIESGEVFALLGPNGAGKTTTVEILEGHRKASSGDVQVLGMDPGRGERDFKDRIGIVLQETSVERELTVGEALEIYGASYSRRRPVGELVEIVGLTEKTDARIGTLSGGQKRRLELALGIVGDPDLIFLDEPTTGFDPSARRDAWGVIDNLRSLGKTILLTTHYMDEAQSLSDRVAVIADGLIVAEGTPENLGGRQLSATTISFRVDHGVVVPFDGELLNGHFHAATDDPTRLLNAITSWALETGVDLRDITVARPSLEDVYLSLTEVS